MKSSTLEPEIGLFALGELPIRRIRFVAPYNGELI